MDNRVETPEETPLRKKICNFLRKFITNVLLIYIFLSFDLLLGVLFVLGLLLGCVLYKVYVAPFNFGREILDVGYDLVNGRNRSLNIARSVAARRYGNQLPPPYPNGWYSVADSRDLKIGDVQAVNVLGENLCVYRCSDGTACCVYAYCPHLGANLALGGVVKENCLECPFHRWTFDTEGNCAFVPGQNNPPKGALLKTWITCEAEGAVWIWYDAEGAPPRWVIKNLKHFNEWGYRGKIDFVVNSHIQDIPENGADVAHLNAVHSPPMESQDLLPDLGAYLGKHHWYVEWYRGGANHTCRIKLSHEYRIWNIYAFSVLAEIYQTGPSHIRIRLSTPGGPLLVSQTITPLSPLQQRVIHRVFSPTYNAVVAAIYLWIEAGKFKRDALIWNNKRFVHNPILSTMDARIKDFRAWYSQFYSEASLSFKDALKRQNNPLDW